jgi:pyridoxamine 5'-phosphate oxidase
MAQKEDVSDLARLRQEYSALTIDESQMDADPFVEFDGWLKEALKAKVHEPNAMCVATCNLNTGMPSARYMLLKGFDADGFVWFTNYQSRKGDDLATNPKAALCFWWPDLERSVRIEGMVAQVSQEESDDYFNKRPPQARLGAMASDQSRTIASHQALDSKFQALQEEFLEGNELKKEVKRPDNWGGYRLQPIRMEFWKGRASRVHDRVEYARPTTESLEWTKQRLQP